MSDIISQIVFQIFGQWQQQSIAEIVAVIFAIGYVWLAAEQKIWCWPSALISTSLFTYVFWDVSLVFQMLLNAYYAVMAIIGWLSWRKSGQLTVKNVQTMDFKQHAIVILLGLLLTSLLVVFASHWLSYDMLWLDAGITMLSLIITWLTVRKYLESWIYWTVINSASILLFASVELYFSVCLMLVYIGLALRGYVQWKASITSENQVPVNA